MSIDKPQQAKAKGPALHCHKAGQAMLNILERIIPQNMGPARWIAPYQVKESNGIVLTTVTFTLILKEKEKEKEKRKERIMLKATVSTVT